MKANVLPWMRKHVLVSAALIASLVVAFYWVLLASDRYVSTAHVLIQRTDLPGGSSMDFSSLLAGVNSSNRTDQLLLRDHLLSVDMLQKLDQGLNLRQHYSSTKHDLFSRMWGEDRSMEWFHRHYLSRVSIELDDYSGVLMIRAQAYDATTAQLIASALVQEGERFMNQLAHQLAQAQVQFLEQQVQGMDWRLKQARQAVLNYQDRKGLVSPAATAESLSAIVAQLEAKRADLQTQRAGLQAYLVPSHPQVVMLGQQIEAVEKQLNHERAKLAAPKGSRLNRTVEEFQRLEADAKFAQDVYQTALVALEKGRVEATRTIKKVSVLQAPSSPEYPLEPRRAYNSLVFLLAALLLAGVAHLVLAIVRDHTD